MNEDLPDKYEKSEEDARQQVGIQVTHKDFSACSFAHS